MTTRRWRRFRWWRVPLIVVIVYAGAVLMLAALERKVLFPRFRTDPAATPPPSTPGREILQLPIDEGTVEAWFLPGDGVSASAPGPAVIFAHGNGEVIDQWPDLLSPYLRMGISMLLPEYRGYGRSAGSPAQDVITEDFVRFHDLLVQREEVDASRIVFHGRSLGGGVACALAARRVPAALILQSTFTSVRAMAWRFLVPGFLVADPFDNLAVVSRLRRPILLIHGTADTLIPVRHAHRLHEAAPTSQLVLYPAQHNDCPPDWDRFWVDLAQFLEQSKIRNGTT